MLEIAGGGICQGHTMFNFQHAGWGGNDGHRLCCHNCTTAIAYAERGTTVGTLVAFMRFVGLRNDFTLIFSAIPAGKGCEKNNIKGQDESNDSQMADC